MTGWYTAERIVSARDVCEGAPGKDERPLNHQCHSLNRRATVASATLLVFLGGALSAVLGLASADTTDSHIGFATAVTYYSAAEYTEAVVAADLNHDHRDDLIVGDTDTEGGADKMTVFLARRDGQFQQRGVYGNDVGPIAVADFNRDGDPDVVRLSYEVASVRLGNGHGVLDKVRRYPLAISIDDASPNRDLAVGDFNHDHVPDLVVTEEKPYRVRSPRGRVLLGTGSGGLSPGYPIELGRSPTSVATRDFDHDRTADLAVTDGAFVRVFGGDGDGNFARRARYEVGRAARSLAVGNFNRDGRPDLVVRVGNTRRTRGIRLLLANRAGRFRVSRRYAIRGVGDFALADFDRDGRVDLASVAITRDRPRTVSVMRGNGAGALSSPLRFDEGRCYQCDVSTLATGRFDDDRRPDLAVSRGIDNGIDVLLASPR